MRLSGARVRVHRTCLNATSLFHTVTGLWDYGCLPKPDLLLVSEDMKTKRFLLATDCVKVCIALTALLCAIPHARSSENVPHRPFAQWAELPKPGDIVVGLIYEESEAYHIWAPGNQQVYINVKAGGENYGIDINQGYLALQYGLLEKWALDLNIGYTTMGTRSFNEGNHIQSTDGLMDWSFGVRYEIFNEHNPACAWMPTLTFRAGGVLPGTFDEEVPFAPGLRSAAIEPELLFRKHFAWPGFGAYGDVLYRWNRTTHNDQYITTIGLFQQIKGWELAVGYRHLQSLSGSDITFDDPNDFTTLNYPRDPREINDSIEAGFSYTTAKHRIRYGFHSRTVVDGSNSDRKFWLGGSIDIPFSTRRNQ